MTGIFQKVPSCGGSLLFLSMTSLAISALMLSHSAVRSFWATISCVCLLMVALVALTFAIGEGTEEVVS